MKIQIMSDLHIDWGSYKIENKNKADILIIAGDTIVAQKTYIAEFKQMINEASKLYKHIVDVTGNHSYYHEYIEKVDRILSDISFEVPNFNYLNISHVEIDDYIFVGGTLWSDFNRRDDLSMRAAQERMTDFKLITDVYKGIYFGKITPEKLIPIHCKTKEYINKIAKENPNKKVVVVTHHAPSSVSISIRYKGDIISNAYYSDLSELILDNPNIVLWCHGHVHCNNNYMIGNCRVISNPRGYCDYQENPNFNPDLVLEI